VQAYVSDEVVEKINAIVEKRVLEGLRIRMSVFQVSSMFLSLGFVFMKLKWNVKNLVSIRWHSIRLCLNMLLKHSFQ
jgi:hypothetical protein